MASLEEYVDENKRLRATPRYGPETAEVTPEIVDQIANLTGQLAKASRALQDARHRYQEVAHMKAGAEEEFARISSRLIDAIQEQREGMLENVPYQP